MKSDKERLRSLGLHEFFFSSKGAGWVDESGYLSAMRIRQRYMLAGLIPPTSDNAEDLFSSIEANTKLLNNYLTHSGELKDYTNEPLVVKKIPKKPKVDAKRPEKSECKRPERPERPEKSDAKKGQGQK